MPSLRSLFSAHRVCCSCAIDKSSMRSRLPDAKSRFLETFWLAFPLLSITTKDSRFVRFFGIGKGFQFLNPARTCRPAPFVFSLKDLSIGWEDNANVFPDCVSAFAVANRFAWKSGKDCPIANGQGKYCSVSIFSQALHWSRFLQVGSVGGRQRREHLPV